MIPDWPRLVHREPCAAYHAIRDCLDWLEAAAAVIPASLCVVCTTAGPRRERGLCPSCYQRTAHLEDYLFLTARGEDEQVALARISRRGRQVLTPRTMDRKLADLRKHTDIRHAGVPPQLQDPDMTGLPVDVHDELARLAWLAADFDVTRFPQTGESLTTRQAGAAFGGLHVHHVRDQISAGQLPAMLCHLPGGRRTWKITPAAVAVHARQRWLASLTESVAA